MAITASMVAELRAKTDAPMMECKKALTEAEGNFEKAEEILRVKLGSKAGKAASRITAEGVVAASVQGSNQRALAPSKKEDLLSDTHSWGSAVLKQRASKAATSARWLLKER